MESSAKEAILVLSKWNENSSMLRMVFGNDHVQIRLPGTLAKVTAESLSAHGASVEEDLQVYTLTGELFAFVEGDGFPPGIKELSRLNLLDEVVSIVWPDRSRLTIFLEKENPSAKKRPGLCDGILGRGDDL